MDELTPPPPCEATAHSRRIELRFADDRPRRLEVWRREGDTAGWELITTTGRPTFVDRPTKPGQYYEYRTREVREAAASEFSRSTVVYGR
ncbi:MAG: hypothetical protein LC113_12285 [Acidobacteria bacterium]|nr:hypothetical protein [Acidobacteriota bacterium]